MKAVIYVDDVILKLINLRNKMERTFWSIFEMVKKLFKPVNNLECIKTKRLIVSKTPVIM